MKPDEVTPEDMDLAAAWLTREGLLGIAGAVVTVRLAAEFAAVRAEQDRETEQRVRLEIAKKVCGYCFNEKPRNPDGEHVLTITAPKFESWVVRCKAVVLGILHAEEQDARKERGE